MCTSLFSSTPSVSIPAVTSTADDPEAERRVREAERAEARRALNASRSKTVATSALGDTSSASLMRATLG